MKWLNPISSLVLMVFSVLIFISAFKLGIGNPKDPGPGFMPCLASVLVFSLSSVVLLKGKNGPDRKRSSRGQKSVMKPLLLVIIILGYSFLLDVVGYLATAFLLMFAMFSLVEPKKWPRNVVLAAGIVILSFLLFKILLGVRLPMGMLRI